MVQRRKHVFSRFTYSRDYLLPIYLPNRPLTQFHSFIVSFVSFHLTFNWNFCSFRSFRSFRSFLSISLHTNWILTGTRRYRNNNYKKKKQQKHYSRDWTILIHNTMSFLYNTVIVIFCDSFKQSCTLILSSFDNFSSCTN